MIALLLNRGALINAGDHTNWTALHFACQAGELDAIQLLIAHGANVNARTSSQVTPIMVAVQTNNPRILDYLISQGGDVKAAEEDGFTALHYCGQNSYPASARALLAKGALVDARDKVRHTACFSSLLDGCLQAGRTPLLIATAKADLETMCVLLENRASAEAEDNDGATPMILAIGTENYEKILLLFQYGGIVDACNNTNQVTSLMSAASNGRVDLVNLCLTAGCNVHSRDKVFCAGGPILEMLCLHRMDGLLCILLQRPGMLRLAECF